MEIHDKKDSNILNYFIIFSTKKYTTKYFMPIQLYQNSKHFWPTGPKTRITKAQSLSRRMHKLHHFALSSMKWLKWIVKHWRNLWAVCEVVDMLKGRSVAPDCLDFPAKMSCIPSRARWIISIKCTEQIHLIFLLVRCPLTLYMLLIWATLALRNPLSFNKI